MRRLNFVFLPSTPVVAVAVVPYSLVFANLRLWVNEIEKQVMNGKGNAPYWIRQATLASMYDILGICIYECWNERRAML